MSIDPVPSASLIADLNCTFLGIDARPREGKGASWFAKCIWANGGAQMPDGMPIFSTLHECQREFDGVLHDGFIAWLERRGWYALAADAGAVLLTPIPVVAVAIERLTEAWYRGAEPTVLRAGESPF